MTHVRFRLTAAATLVLLASAAAACGGTAAAAEQTAGAVQIEPVNMVIQMSGLLLLVPPKQPDGATQVLMPRIPGHVAYIGFRQDSSAICNEHNKELNICYIDVKDWTVEPIGVAAASIPVIPAGALNLTRGSGDVKVDTTKPQVRERIMSQLSFLSGSVTDSCALARWTFDPYGLPLPQQLPLINVLEWQIPNLPSETLELVLRSRKGPPREKRVTLRANEAREIELLVLHVTEEEGAPFTTAGWMAAGQAPSTSPALSPAAQRGAATAPSPHPAYGNGSQRVRRHFHALYGLLDADTVRRRMPTRPNRIREVCPITILDLAEFDEEVSRGIRTFSCIMASAEGA
jgi:hypothetical protein